MRRRLLISLAVVGIAALLGLSFAKVSETDPWAFAVGFAAIAAVAIGIAGLFHRQVSSFEKAVPSRKLLGLRISVVGIAIAFGGWLLSVFVSAAVGYYVVVLGVLAGFLGFPIHFYNMFERKYRTPDPGA